MSIIAIVIAALSAIGSLTNAFFKKPIDAWWDKRLNPDKPEKPETHKTSLLKRTFNFLLGYVFPVLTVVYWTLYNKFDKTYVIVVSTTVCLIFLQILLFLMKEQNEVLTLHSNLNSELQDRTLVLIENQQKLLQELANSTMEALNNMNGNQEKNIEIFQEFLHKLDSSINQD